MILTCFGTLQVRAVHADGGDGPGGRCGDVARDGAAARPELRAAGETECLRQDARVAVRGQGIV